MKLVMQTVIGSGEKGEVAGNCMRACLASIMEIDIDDMPPFENLEQEKWFKTFYEWLEENGYEYKGWGRPEHINDPKFAKGIDGYVMAAGGSPRGFPRGHAVVYKNGEMVHDPHPSGEGITTLDGFFMIERK